MLFLEITYEAKLAGREGKVIQGRFGRFLLPFFGESFAAPDRE